MIIAALVVIFGYILLHHTRTGRTIYAIGGSRSSAELMGLPVKRTQYVIYLTSATLAPSLHRVHGQHPLFHQHGRRRLGT